MYILKSLVSLSVLVSLVSSVDVPYFHVTRNDAVTTLIEMVNSDITISEKLKDLYILGIQTRFVNDGMPDPLYHQILNYKAYNTTYTIEAPISDPAKMILSNTTTVPDTGASRNHISFCPNDDCTQPVTLNGIWNYGCWCNFGENLLKGQSQPVNIYDRVCRDLQLCLRCAKLDSNAEDGSGSSASFCDPKTKVYNSEFSFLPYTQEAMIGACSDANPGDNCAIRCCSCELDLINELLTILWSGDDLYTSDYLHENGWDYVENCPGNGGKNRPKKCCGFYPNRFPYTEVKKQCCESSQQLYNPVHAECCDTGVHSIGVC